MTLTLQQGLEVLVHENQHKLQWYLRVHGCADEEIPDLLQEIFLRFYRRVLAQGMPEKPKAYLRTVARNLVIDRARQQKLPLLVDTEAIEAAWRVFEHDDEALSYLDALRVCLGTLGRVSRRALEQRHGQGLSRAEIARELGKSEAALKTLMGRARKKLRLCIKERIAR